MPISTKYTYSISADFPGGSVNTTKLQSEIQRSSIIIALDHIDTVGDVLDIWFKDVISLSDKTILDNNETAPAGGLIALHDNTISIENIFVEVKNIPDVRAQKPSGSRAYIFSVDFCKRETWYVDSIKITNENVGTGDGNTTQFNLGHGTNINANEAIVDLNHFKITDEHMIAPPTGSAGGYVPVVKIDDVLKTEREAFETGGDYEINYTSGQITFYTAPANGLAITCTYYYVPTTAGPKIQFGPPTGKKWSIEVAEAQFAKDINLNDTIIGNVFVKGTNYPVSTETRLGHIGNILDYTYGSLPTIPAFGGTTRGLSQDILILRWDYMTPIILYASYNLEMRVWTKHQRPLIGERATITYYAIETPE